MVVNPGERFSYNPLDGFESAVSANSAEIEARFARSLQVIVPTQIFAVQYAVD